jgi:hypothetical protein
VGIPGRAGTSRTVALTRCRSLSPEVGSDVRRQDRHPVGSAPVAFSRASRGSPIPSRRRQCRRPFCSRPRMGTVLRAISDDRRPYGESRRKVPESRCPKTANQKSRLRDCRLVSRKMLGHRQILRRGRENLESHSNRFRSSFLAASQSIGFSSPAATRRSVSRSASACQAGDSNACSSWLRSAQSASIALSLSSRVI